MGQVAGRFWIAALVTGQVADEKTTDRQAGPGAVRLKSECDPNAESEKPVQFEKLDRAYGRVAMGLRLGDS